jgi:hypothetical protein
MYLRRLDLTQASDLAVAAGLFLQTPAYAFDSFARLPTAAQAARISEAFPSETPPENRLSFAACRHDQAIALAQVALHHPSPDCAALLLLLVPPAQQREHVGCEFVERLSRQARRWPGITRWVLAVGDHNGAGLALWRHCGFRSMAMGLHLHGFAGGFIRMERPIKAKPACQHARERDDPDDLIAQNFFARLR